MKFVEPIKSFLLFSLVLLSLLFTIMIWNYKPNHKIIDNTAVEEASIGPQKSVQDIMKPYRVLFHYEDEFRGTVSASYVDEVYEHFANWKATDLTLINNRLSIEKTNELMQINNRMMLFFDGEVPLHVFMEVLSFENEELPQISFDRLIIDWNDLAKDRKLNLFLLNTKNHTLYRTSVEAQNENVFEDALVEPINKSSEYMEYLIENQLSIYSTKNQMESVKYMYYIDELSIDQFKKVLFEDPGIVKKSVESVTLEKYNDGMSFMTVDTRSRFLNYVYPASEGIAEILPSDLVKDSFNFINYHGGFNSDFRISTINKDMHTVEYRFYYQGFPVFSDETITKLTTTWGDKQVYKYRRPYYVLEMDIPSEMEIKELPAGEEVINDLIENRQYDFTNVNDLVLGYYLQQSSGLRVFELMPSWFVITETGWEPIDLSKQGGMNNGLE